mgnify:CR=1 FL=1
MTKDKEQIPDHILNSKDTLRDSIGVNTGNIFQNKDLEQDAQYRQQHEKQLAKDKADSKYNNIYRELSKKARKQIDDKELDLNNPLRYFAWQFNKITKGNNKFDLSKLKYDKNRYMKGPSDWKKTKGEFSEIQRTKELGREEKFERNKQIMHPKDSLDFKEHADKEQRELDESTKESFRQRDERLTKERWPDYSPEELKQEQRLADMAEQHKIYDEDNRNTTNDPFKGTSIEGKD